jgi:MoaA/NifB/PqqE/SkfB family radical SAM enzyme
MIGWRSPSKPGPLRLLMLAVSDRCDQRCAHCSIWATGRARGRSLDRAARLAVVEEAIAEGVDGALLTGGEPLLAADLWPVAERLRAAGVRLMLATNGMLLEPHASAVGRLFDEVYVSLDGGSPVTHDGIRGVSSWARLGAGVAALRAAAPRVRRVARCTLHAANLHELAGVIAQARSMGFDAVSFLPLDASSNAFGGDVAARRALVPSVAAVRALEADIDRLEAAGAFDDGFVLEDAAKLRRLARHLAASAGAAEFERPPCDAPWWSMVVEADGAVRPCFFQPAVGAAADGLRAVRSSAAYRAALGEISGANPTCARCVCPKRLERPARARLPWPAGRARREAR